MPALGITRYTVTQEANVRTLVGEWREGAQPPGTGRSVILHLGVRSPDGQIALAICEPSLEEGPEDLIGLIMLSAADAAEMVDRLMHGLDQAGHGSAVDRKLEARTRALRRTRPRSPAKSPR